MEASKVFIVFAEFLIATLIGILIMAIVLMSIPYVKKLIMVIRYKITILKKNLVTSIAIRSIKQNSNISSVELVFELFVNFYEKQMQDMGAWELPVEFFPKGKSELSHLYKWIKKVRGENYKEFSHLTFNENTETIRYWRAVYKTFKHKFVDDELKIEPSDDFESSNYSLAFRRRYMHAENDLFDLDTKKATWIIERRRFFNF